MRNSPKKVAPILALPYPQVASMCMSSGPLRPPLILSQQLCHLSIDLRLRLYNKLASSVDAVTIFEI